MALLALLRWRERRVPPEIQTTLHWMETSPVPMWAVDADGQILAVNAAALRVSGRSRSDLLGSGFACQFEQPERVNDGCALALQRGAVSDFPLLLLRSLGEPAELLGQFSVVGGSDGARHVLVLGHDVTERNQTLAQQQRTLEQMANFDTLTRLPNRLLLADRLRQSLRHSERRARKVAVAYLDLDGFKVVNETHGHDVGDRLLVAVAERLAQALREGDTLARLGGDELVAVLSDLEHIGQAASVLERMLHAARQPVRIGALELRVSASIGVTYYPQPTATDAEQLLRQADQAMYHAKLAGKDRYAVFDAENDRTLRGQHASVERIRQALEHEEFVLYYQPKVNMRTREFVGVEALIRWQHPQEGLLAPARFLPLIENHMLSVALGEWMLHKALLQLSHWQREGRLVPVSVNINALHFQRPDFCERLQTLLRPFPELPRGSLQIEILETSALEDLGYVVEAIRRCSALGVDFALDDFGTGYSSLTYLRQLPIPMVKIDQSFVRDMLVDADHRAILDGILWIMRQLQRNVIAEGVETLEHGRSLMDLGCELAQGYGIARPMPVEALAAWQARWQQDNDWIAVSKVPRTAI